MSDDQNLNRYQNDSTPEKKHGGKRPGAGRKKGSTNKITAEEFFQSYKKITKSEYLQDLVGRLAKTYEYVNNANNSREFDMAINNAHKYDTLVAKYLFTDIQQHDITSNGESLGVQLVFTPKELPEWKKPE